MSHELSGRPISRREFSWSVFGLTLGLSRSHPAWRGALEEELVIGALRPASQGGAVEAFADGVAMGMDEASRAANLFRRRVSSVTEAYESGDQILPAFSAIRRNNAQVVVAAAGDDAAARVAKLCSDAGIVLINAAAQADSLRRVACPRFVFHVAASDAMYDSVANSAGANRSSVALWTPSLEKYGAAQLNDRFSARTGRPMSSLSWAGWMAVKVAWEASLRAGSVTADRIAAFLGSSGASFDGHKGAPLSFRDWDHQLRQPMYVVDSAKGNVLAEIPDLARTAGSVRDVLDTIGDRAADGRCSAGVS